MAFPITPGNSIDSLISSETRRSSLASKIGVRDISPEADSESSSQAFYYFNKRGKRSSSSDDFQELNAEGHFLNVADEALQELGSILARISEIAEEAELGIVSDRVRARFSQEVSALSRDYADTLSGSRFDGERILEKETFQSRSGNSGEREPSRIFKPTVPVLPFVTVSSAEAASSTRVVAESTVSRINHLNAQLQASLEKLHAELSKPALGKYSEEELIAIAGDTIEGIRSQNNGEEEDAVVAQGKLNSEAVLKLLGA